MRLALSMSDQRIRRALLVVPLSLLVTGCAETLVYGERSGFNLAIRVDPAQSAPLEVNGGIQRRVVGIIPPQKRTEANGSPDSEAVNMLSNFSLNYDEDDSSLFGGELSIRTSFASGRAAIKIAGGKNATDVVAAITGANSVLTAEQYNELRASVAKCYFPGGTKDSGKWNVAVDRLVQQGVTDAPSGKSLKAAKSMQDVDEKLGFSQKTMQLLKANATEQCPGV